MKKQVLAIVFSLVLLLSLPGSQVRAQEETLNGNIDQVQLTTQAESSPIEVATLIQVDEEQEPWLIRAQVIDGLTGELIAIDYYLSHNTVETTMNQIHDEYIKNNIQIDPANTEMGPAIESVSLDSAEATLELPIHQMDMQVWEFDDTNEVTSENLIEESDSDLTQSELEKETSSEESIETVASLSSAQMDSQESIVTDDESQETDSDTESSASQEVMTIQEESETQESVSVTSNEIIDEETSGESDTDKMISETATQSERNEIATISSTDSIDSSEINEATLPQTGENNNTWLIIIGIVILVVGIGLVIVNRRKGKND